VAPVRVTQYTDPSCPWAYSAEPCLRGLEWRYGDGLEWRTVMIGLSEDTRARERAGVTPESRVEERDGAAAATRMLRGLRLEWFTSTLLLDADEGIAEVAEAAGLDGAAIVAGIDDPDVEAAYQRDRAEARSAAETGAPAVAQGRAAGSESGTRFTAPSLVFERDGRRLVAGGWQPFDAYDLCVANLAPELPRRPRPEPADLLAAYPSGLVTVEVAEVCRERNDDRSPADVATALAELERAGIVRRTPIGDDDGLWQRIA
jgi:2-hydroxychromene-2-carboxylate isomerase